MKIYVIKNAEGKFFKPSGMGGSSVRWKDTIEEAKIYTKIGPCKSQVTGHAQWFIDKKLPIPYLSILEFNIDPLNPSVIHEGKPIADASIKKIAGEKEKRQKKRDAYLAAQRLADDLKAKLYR
jgi:hypothetical protein